MSVDLRMTNVFLGIIAAVSLLQALSVVGVFVAGFLLYRRMVRVIDGIEQRQVAPAVARVNAILDDVKGVSATVRKEAGQIERLVDWIAAAVSRRSASSTDPKRP
jgi:uncharacterized membrane protein